MKNAIRRTGCLVAFDLMQFCNILKNLSFVNGARMNNVCLASFLIFMLEIAGTPNKGKELNESVHYGKTFPFQSTSSLKKTSVFKS